MVISPINQDLFRLELSRTELITMSNCLNEASSGLYLQEFHSRIGVDKEDVKKLIDQILAALDAKG